MLTRTLCLCCLLLLSLTSEGAAFAWGERGHDLIARVALRVLVQRAGKDRRLTHVLTTKEHLLGHLANVPDIIWRSLGRDTEALNAPTHYMDLEYAAAAPSMATLPRQIKALEAQMAALCTKPPEGYVCPEAAHDKKPKASMIGTAPFRIVQLSGLLEQSFIRARESRKGAAFTAAVNDALLDAGLLAHFVGDLAQPYHATRDYDGWDSGHGGIHAYYETDVVNALPLSLDQDVFLAALSGADFKRVAALLPAADVEDPLSLAYALALDSKSRIKDVDAIDAKHAVVKASRSDKGMRIKAERRGAETTAAAFQDITVERLATGADVLAHLWQNAWEKAGRPDLSAYQDYAYPVAPAFIRPDYL